MSLSPLESFSRYGLLVAMLMGGSVARGQDYEKPVEMPPFVVTGQVAGPNWRYAQIDGFEILSQSDDGKAREVVKALWRGKQMILPSSLLTRFSTPMTVVIFDQPPVKTGGGPEPLGSVRGANEENSHWTNVIKRRLADHESFAINLWHFEFEFSNAFRFDTNTLLQRRAPAAPQWLKEGLFGRYGLYREGWRWHPGDARMRVPRAWWFSDDEARQAAQNYELEQERIRFPKERLAMSTDLMLFVPPLRELLEQRSPAKSDVAVVAPPGTSSGKLSEGVETTLVLPKMAVVSDFPDRLASTAALFVRWGIYGRSAGDAQQFWRFAERSCAEPVTLALFQECFGMSYEQVRLELVRYLPTAVCVEVSVPAPPVTPLPTLEFRTATVTEIARVRGEWERMEAVALAGRFPELARQYREKAGRTFATVTGMADARDPRLLASRGLLALDSGDPAQARELLEAAVAGNVIGPRVYFEVARLRWQQLAESNRKPDAAVVAGVVGLLLAAERQSPHLRAVYLFLAEAARYSGPFSAEHRAALRRGLEYFPKDETVRAAVTAALERGEN